jgi:hypothetical protein
LSKRFVRFGGVIAALILMAAVWRAPQPHAAASQLMYDADPRDDASVFARINSGGYEGQHLKYGYFWSADQAYSGGKVTANPAASIAGTDDDDLYRRARVATADLGGFGYAIALPLVTTYTVRLHFAETYWGATNGGPGGAGRRVFSANFEGGAAELANYDINAEVGPLTAVVKEFSVPVSDGVLNIDFSASVNRPIISAIEVLLYDAPAAYWPAAINGFWINADTDQMLDIPEYEDETDGLKPINLATLPTLNLNIVAEPTASVSSIKFIYEGQVHIENTAPFAAFGNPGGDYLPWTPTAGEHELTIIGYTQPNAQGVAGPTRRFYFQVSDVAGTATPTFVPGTTTPTFVPGTPTSVPATHTPTAVPGTATSIPATSTPTSVPGTLVPPFWPTPLPTQTPWFKVGITEQLQWHTQEILSVGDYDVIIVQDTSQSMRYCWDRNQTCPVGQRRIDYGTSVVRQLINELLVNRAAQGFTSRVAYITYGSEQNGSSANVRIPFSSAPADYEALVGSLGNPRSIPDAEISGYTNTAAALKLAEQELANAREVDQNGSPVKRVVILISDGTADALFDAPYAGQPNRYDAAPFFCGSSADDINNPLVQASCPRGSQFNEPRAPIKAAIDVATDLQANTGVPILSVVTGSPNGYTPVDLQFHLISPDRYYLASNPWDLAALFDGNFYVEIGESCQEYRDVERVAAGAVVTIANQSGGIVAQGTLNSNGELVAQLSPGTYSLSVAHNAVISPNDPLRIARNYTRLIPSGTNNPVSALTFVMGNSNLALTTAKLVIDNPVNAMCPQ